jgi:hypothetical protein
MDWNLDTASGENATGRETYVFEVLLVPKTGKFG